MIYMMANKERTYRMKASMMMHYDRARALSLVAVKDTKIVGDHRLIMEAIRNRNVAEAQAQTRKHLSRYDLDKEEIKTVINVFNKNNKVENITMTCTDPENRKYKPLRYPNA